MSELKTRIIDIVTKINYKKLTNEKQAEFDEWCQFALTDNNMGKKQFMEEMNLLRKSVPSALFDLYKFETQIANEFQKRNEIDNNEEYKKSTFYPESANNCSVLERDQINAALLFSKYAQKWSSNNDKFLAGYIGKAPNKLLRMTALRYMSRTIFSGGVKSYNEDYNENNNEGNDENYNEEYNEEYNGDDNDDYNEEYNANNNEDYNEDNIYNVCDVKSAVVLIEDGIDTMKLLFEYV